MRYCFYRLAGRAQWFIRAAVLTPLRLSTLRRVAPPCYLASRGMPKARSAIMLR